MALDTKQLLQEGDELLRNFISTQSFRGFIIKAGDYILKQHAPVDEIYWASPAYFCIRHTAKNGKRLSLGEYSLESNLFGELEHFSGRLCNFDMLATANMQLTAIPSEKLSEFLLNESKAAYWFNHRIADIYQHTMQIALDRATLSLKHNIIKDLIDKHTSKTPWFNHSYMYQEAERFGCTERAYSRVINELLKDGLIIRRDERSTFEPTDIENLKKYLEMD